MELVEERRVAGQMRLEIASERFVADVGGHHPMARKHAARVGVGDENRPVEGIEQDGVGRFGPDAAHPEKLGSQGFKMRPAQPLQAAAGPLNEEDRERAEPPRRSASAEAAALRLDERQDDQA